MKEPFTKPSGSWRPIAATAEAGRQPMFSRSARLSLAVVQSDGAASAQRGMIDVRDVRPWHFVEGYGEMIASSNADQDGYEQRT
jgi:hypothetical protein